MDKVLKLLNSKADKEYAIFQAKLTPNVAPELFIGVRVPEVRNLAKTFINDKDSASFLEELPHKYYDEYMLHGVLISLIKDYDKVIYYLDKFLPYVDNWAVCDICSPKCFKKHKIELLKEIEKWIKSKHTFTIRFGIEMLMSWYLDDDFKKEYLEMVSIIRSNEYYVNMMIAWFFATALTKQWGSTIKYIEENKLSPWVHNKTIQKAIESYRITNEQKDYLRKLKV